MNRCRKSSQEPHGRWHHTVGKGKAVSGDLPQRQCGVTEAPWDGKGGCGSILMNEGLWEAVFRFHFKCIGKSQEGFKKRSGHGLIYILKETSDVKNKSDGTRVTAG